MAVSPLKWIKSGSPLPVRKRPPLSLLDYYSCPKKRGYLADSDLKHTYRSFVTKVGPCKPLKMFVILLFVFRKMSFLFPNIHMKVRLDTFGLILLLGVALI